MLATSLYSVTGGSTTATLATYSLLAATTPAHLRTSRIGLLHVVCTAGWIGGTLLSPIIFHAGGYYATFLSALLVFVTSLASTCTFLRDLPPEPPEPPASGQPPPSSRLASLLACWRCLVQPRPGATRAAVLLLLATMLLLVAAQCGGHSYLFTRRMFHWTEAEYSRLSSLSSLLSSVASLLILPLLSLRLHLPDQAIGLLAAASGFTDLLVTSMVRTGPGFVFAKCLGLFGGQASIAIRSLLSKLLPTCDLAKVYCTMGVLENLVPLLVSPGLTLLYNSTLATWPGAVYAVEAAILATAAATFALVIRLLAHPRDTVLLEDETNS